jgi:hypothetical protein
MRRATRDRLHHEIIPYRVSFRKAGHRAALFRDGVAAPQTKTYRAQS